MIAAIIPDRFASAQSSLVIDSGTNRRDRQRVLRNAQMADVRRPTRGIQLKEDTYATLKLLKGDGTEIPLVNAGSRFGDLGPDGKMRSDTYSNFLIQSISEERVEKSQVVETFGEAFIFFYGQRPRVLTIQGALINTFDFNWESEWWHNYDTYLRGTRCVEQSARVYMTFDDTLVSGYIMSTSSSKNATERNFVPFIFQLYVTDYTPISVVGDPNPDQRGEPPSTGNRQAEGLQQPRAMPVRYYNRSGGAPLVGVRPGGPTSLLEGLVASGLGIVNSAWNAAGALANLAVLPAAYLDYFLGNPVRIPVGFEGAVVFDETLVSLDIAPQLQEPIRYSLMFGDNTDEFVSGEFWQYDSSSMQSGAAFFDTFDTSNTIRVNNDLSVWARKQFEFLGMIPPQGLLTDVMTLLAMHPIGLVAIGAARSAIAKPTMIAASSMSTALTAAAPYVAGANVIGANVALADNVLGMATPRASQALDRALGMPPTPAMSSLQTESDRLAIEANGVNTYKRFLVGSSIVTIGGEPPVINDRVAPIVGAFDSMTFAANTLSF